MRSTPYSPPSDRRRAPLGRRATIFLLVLAIHVLLVFVLLMLAPRQHPTVPPEPKAFTLLPIQPPSTPAPAPRVKSKSGGAAPHSSPKPSKTTTPKAHAQPSSKEGQKPFGTELFDAVDIAALPNHRNDSKPGEGADGTGAGKDSGSAYGPGAGPGGERLYDAEWYSEPTHAELSYYMPHGAPMGSWGTIACRTVEKNRVEDCRELDESPAGSGLARALRQAAWQFRVLPPRIGGHPVIGAWVRIRIDFSETGVEKTP